MVGAVDVPTLFLIAVPGVLFRAGPAFTFGGLCLFQRADRLPEMVVGIFRGLRQAAGDGFKWANLRLGEPQMSTVMIAEDELLIADMMAEVLADSGYDICGIARSVAEAIELGERCTPDLAIIDLHLADGGIGSEIGARLRRGGKLSVLYITGSLGEAVLTADDGDACLHKPFRLADLAVAVTIVERIANAEAADLPMPRNLEMLSHRPDERIPETVR